MCGKVAVVILNYNASDLSIELVKQLENIEGIENTDIVIVDNNSTDDSLIILTEAKKVYDFTLIASEKNAGYAAGNNIGLRWAFQNGYQYALVVNNDVIIEDKKILEKLLRGFEIDSEIAIVSPRIKLPSGRETSRKLCRPTFWDETVNLISYKAKNHGTFSGELKEWEYTYAPQGCCMIARLAHLDEVNYMDENTFLYCEEAILAERLLNKKYRCIYIADAEVIHNHSVVIMRSMDRKRKLRIIRESKWYLRKTYYKYNFIKLCMAYFFDVLADFGYSIKMRVKKC